MQLSELLEEVRSKEEKLRRGEPPAGYSVFTPDLPDRIREAIKKAEGKSKARCLLPGHVAAVLEALATHPAGRAWAHGGSAFHWKRSDKYKKVSYFSVRWFTFRRRKIVEWRVGRVATHVCPIPPSTYPDYAIDVARDAKLVWEVFPERSRLLCHLKQLRRLRPLGVQPPADAVIEKIIELDTRVRLAWVEAWVETSHWNYRQRWLLTPLGAFAVSQNVRTLSGAFREVTGCRFLEKFCVWEDVEPLFVMAALK